MDNSTDFLSQFSTKSRRPTQSIAVQVEGYILPPGNERETPHNARLVGRRWDTQEPVEIALRELTTNAERPGIRQFNDDSQSSNPVTTRPGGTVIVDGVYEDSSLEPATDNIGSVLSGQWVTRIAETDQDGWGMTSLAKVNEPRLKSANNPAEGYFQTVTILRNEQAFAPSSIEQVDKAVLLALDSERRDQDRLWHLRPGAVTAHIRLTQGEYSEVIELRGGFYTPENGPYAVPKTRAMIAEDLGKNNFWQDKRKLLIKAFETDRVQVEVIPSSNVYVGGKTLQAAMKGKSSRIKGMSYKTGDTEQPLFSQLTLGIRLSPKTGQPQVLFAYPHTYDQIPSRTGKPNRDELARFNSTSNTTSVPATPTPPQGPEQQAPARQAPTAASAPAAAHQPAAQTQSAPQRIAVRPSREDGYLIATATNPAQEHFLKTQSSAVKGRFDPRSKVLSFTSSSLPVLVNAARAENQPLSVDSAPAAQNRDEAQPNAAQPETNTAPAPEKKQNDMDLSSLDLSGLDLDETLSEAYQERESRQGPNR